MIAKIVEMTMDGRLSIIWAAIALLLVAAVWEGVALVRWRKRSVSRGQKVRKY